MSPALPLFIKSFDFPGLFLKKAVLSIKFLILSGECIRKITEIIGMYEKAFEKTTEEKKQQKQIKKIMQT